MELKKNQKPVLTDYMILLVIAYSITSFVPRLISTFLTTYFYLAVLVILFLYFLARKKGEKIQMFLYFLLPFIVWKIWLYLLGINDITSYVYSIFLEFVPMMAGLYLIRIKGGELKLFAITIIVLFIITIITTIIGLNIHPEASRVLATAISSDSEELITYNWMNIGGYEFTYMMVLMYPLVILAFKLGKIKWWFALILTALIATYILFACYTTSLLLFIITSFFWFFKKDLKPFHILIFLFFAILFIALFYGVFAGLLEKLADVINDDIMSPRLRSIAGGRETLEDNEDNRWELWLMSLNTFLRSPIFGTVFEYGQIGGHSFILDFMAQYGLFGLIFLFLMYYSIYKYFFMRYRLCTGYGYIVWMFFQTIVLSVVNTGMWTNILTLFIPVVLNFIYLGKKNESTLDSKQFIK